MATTMPPEELSTTTDPRARTTPEPAARRASRQLLQLGDRARGGLGDRRWSNSQTAASMIRSRRMKRGMMLALAVSAACVACASEPQEIPLDGRDAFHTPIGASCMPLLGQSFTFCAAAEGYCYFSICRPACGGEDKLTCGAREHRVQVAPPGDWPCACVPY
jgi:hypothetical protein